MYKLIPIVIVTVVYWSFSERHIHKGSYIDGALMGFAVSIGCLCIGYAIGKIISKNKLD